MRLQVEPLRPCGELLAAGAAAEDLALDKLCVGAAGRELLERFTHAGAAGGRKEDDGLAGEIVALEEGVDDGRRNVPPDREADEHDVVLGHVVALGCDGGAGRGIVHLDGAAGALVHPVQIGGLVGDRGLDLEYIGAHRLGKRLREVRGSAGGGEVGNKFFHGYTS